MKKQVFNLPSGHRITIESPTHTPAASSNDEVERRVVELLNLIDFEQFELQRQKQAAAEN